MSILTKKTIPTNKDYGRRMYVSGEKSYPEQMRTMTDKAMLDEKPYHLSEIKKPYEVDSYGEMEHFYSYPAGMEKYPDIPKSEKETEYTKTRYRTELRWTLEPPDTVEQGHWYLMEVAKASRTTQSYKGGKLIKIETKYLLPAFNIVKKSAGARGMEVEQCFQVLTNRFTILWEGLVGRLVNFVYEWVKTGTERFIYLLKNIWDGKSGVTVNNEARVRAKLTVEDNAIGTYEVQVTDGQTRLKKEVSVWREGIFIQFDVDGVSILYKLSDFIEGNLIPYSSVLKTGDFAELEGSYSIFSDVEYGGSYPVLTATWHADIYYGENPGGTLITTVTMNQEETYEWITPPGYWNNILIERTGEDTNAAGGAKWNSYYKYTPAINEQISRIWNYTYYYKFIDVDLITITDDSSVTRTWYFEEDGDYPNEWILNGSFLYRFDYLDKDNYIETYVHYNNATGEDMSAPYNDWDYCIYKGKLEGVEFNYQSTKEHFPYAWPEFTIGRGFI